MLVFQKCSNERCNEKAACSTCFVYKHKELNSGVGIHKVDRFRKKTNVSNVETERWILIVLSWTFCKGLFAVRLRQAICNQRGRWLQTGWDLESEDSEKCIKIAGYLQGKGEDSSIPPKLWFWEQRRVVKWFWFWGVGVFFGCGVYLLIYWILFFFKRWKKRIS